MAATEHVTFITTTGAVDVELTKPTPGETTIINGVRFETARGQGGAAYWNVTAADGRKLGHVSWQPWYPTLYFWCMDGGREWVRKGFLHTMLNAFGALVIPNESAA